MGKKKSVQKTQSQTEHPEQESVVADATPDDSVTNEQLVEFLTKRLINTSNAFDDFVEQVPGCIRLPLKTSFDVQNFHFELRTLSTRLSNIVLSQRAAIGLKCLQDAAQVRAGNNQPLKMKDGRDVTPNYRHSLIWLLEEVADQFLTHYE